MLFCSPAEVNDVWEMVAKATANNELGLAAKVAPKPVDESPRKDRLICVYTADFRDRADVGRVLQKLRELRLVEARGRPIYYKPGKCPDQFSTAWAASNVVRRVHLYRDRLWQRLGAQSFHIQLKGRLLRLSGSGEGSGWHGKCQENLIVRGDVTYQRQNQWTCPAKKRTKRQPIQYPNYTMPCSQCALAFYFIISVVKCPAGFISRLYSAFPLFRKVS